MRRFGLFLAVCLAASACTFADPATVTTTTTVATPALSPTTATTVLEVDACRSITSELDAVLVDLGLGQLVGDWRIGPGPIQYKLVGPSAFAEELNLVCSGSFVASSPPGELADVVAAWNDDELAAVIVGLTTPRQWGSDDRIAVEVAKVGPVLLDSVTDELVASEADQWRVAETLDGFIAFAGDTPLRSVGAWNTVLDASVPTLVLQLSYTAGDGAGEVPDFTLYSDGLLLTAASASGLSPHVLAGYQSNRAIPGSGG